MYNVQITIDRISQLIYTSNGKKTKTALNAFCDIDKSTINNSAKSKYGLGAKILNDIADYLSCSVDYLLGRTDSVQYADVNGLSDNELYILQLYRKLNPFQIERIIGRMEQAIEDNEQAKKET